MTATNHALTGALIGLIIGNPYIVVPVAILSHFICDALPHFGTIQDPAGKNWFKRLLVLDASLCIVIVIVLAYNHPRHWLIAAISAFLATSPDLMWINKFRRSQAGIKRVDRPPLLLRIHASVQWFEKPIGAIFEVAWAIMTIILLKLFIV